MDEIKIPEQRFMDLIEHEAKAEELYERVVINLVKRWKQVNKDSLGIFDNKEHIAEYVNHKLHEMGIFLKEPSEVWFTSQGRGSMMYWGFRDSKTIYEVAKILES